MAKKRILFVSPFFFPEKISTGKWNTYVAAELAKTADVAVLCLHPIYPEWKVERSDSQLPDMEIIRRGGRLKFPKNVMLRRAILELYFALTCFLHLLNNKNRYDELIFVFPPSLVGYLCSLIFKGSKVGVAHDLQGVYADKNKSLLGRFVGGVIASVERRTFSRCDRLVFLSTEMLQTAVAAYGLNIENCSVCYPFVTIDKFVDNSRLSRKLDSNRINVVYSGAMGDKQNPDGLVDFMLSVCEKNTSVDAHIFSAGFNYERLKTEYIGRSNNLFFHDLVEEADLPELLLRSDVQIVPQAEGTSAGSLPSKIPNIMASPAKLFLISDADSELTEIFSDIDSVSVNTSWDIEQLLDSMQTLLASNTSEFSRRKELLEQFSLKKVAKSISV